MEPLYGATLWSHSMEPLYIYWRHCYLPFDYIEARTAPPPIPSKKLSPLTLTLLPADGGMSLAHPMPWPATEPGCRRLPP